jgi:arginyl-tRNA synthetase
MKEKLRDYIEQTINKKGFPEALFSLEHPEDLSHGDYATNVAMVIAKKIGRNPKDLAEEIVVELEKNKPIDVLHISVAGPGFINLTLTPTFFEKTIEEILEKGSEYGKNTVLHNQKTVVEFTDPNPFKEFHIGHLMSNTIGESLSRLIEANGAEVKRACYSGDKGVHVAKAVAYALRTKAIWNTVKDVARSYAEGAALFESDEEFKQYVVDINKKIYLETDDQVHDLYTYGRKITLDYFEVLYATLGTKFDYYFFESTTGEFGKELVKEHVGSIFEESEGAIIFRGENRDAKLHTRVFINKEGLPTYEAKELGLAKVKYDTYPYESSIVITGNEVNDYFRVLMCALKEIFPELAEKTHHIGHGMMRLPSGKMSSRKGDAPTAESLIEAISLKVKEKMSTSNKDLSSDESLISAIAVGAIKYSILRQAPGKDIIFDFDSALSFEGDSGPYLQYTNARIHSLLQKGSDIQISPNFSSGIPTTTLEKTLYRFPEIVSRAYSEYAPQHIATFLIEIAGQFNAFYGQHIIVDEKEKEQSAHRLALAKAVSIVLQNGLSLLGMKAPEAM